MQAEGRRESRFKGPGAGGLKEMEDGGCGQSEVSEEGKSGPRRSRREKQRRRKIM